MARFLIAAVLLMFFAVPLSFIAYGASGALGVLTLLLPLVGSQALLLRWLQKKGSDPGLPGDKVPESEGVARRR